MNRLIRVMRAAGVRFSRDGCAFLAQGLAYNAIFAMIPLALLAIAGLGFLYGSQEAQDRFLSTVDDFAPALHDLLADNLKSAVATRGISGVIALVVLVWSGKNLFQGLAYALNRALGVPQGRPIVHDIVASIVMLPVVGVLLMVSTMLPPLVTFATNWLGIRWAAFAQVASFGASVLLVFVIAAILYVFLPNRVVPWTFGIPGAIFTAVTYEIAQIAFTVYTEHANFFHIYGAISTVVAFLLWFYLIGVLFLYGAEICAVWYEQRRPAHAADAATNVA
ncbi:MAG: YihY/virulence factor BrkB family protein [Candidatus Eremiobacteraeota bacterium]|nr:YihY/virulence factor BrkB family protein [Candidatus Eremiobacteraeota bacterium]MBV8354782.1 YihY/virulence factor BrkB family protein [Candidatus Eremiobacteraeota bacterium]